VPEVRAAIAAHHLGAHHAVRRVAVFLDGVSVERLEEARPSGAGLEFGLRGKQRRTTTDAFVRAVFVAVPVLTREGALGAGLAGDLELFGCEALAPLVVGLGQLFAGNLGHAGTNASTPAVVPAC
jgi:hypothetical protein